MEMKTALLLGDDALVRGSTSTTVGEVATLQEPGRNRAVADQSSGSTGRSQPHQM
jgi:hypothetical protein